MKKTQLSPLLIGLTALAFAMAPGCAGGDDNNDDSATGGDSAGTGGNDAGTGGTDAGTGGDDAATGGDDAGTGGADAGQVFGFTNDLEGLYVDYEENLPMGMGGNGFVSTLEHDASDGDPTPGSAKLSTPFDFTGNGEYDTLQKVHVALPFELPQDLTGKTVTSLVKLVTDGSSDPTECPMLAKPFIKSGDDYDWANGKEGLLALDTWIEIEVDTADLAYAADTFDVTDVRLVGIEITPNPMADCVTGSTVALIDTVTIK